MLLPQNHDKVPKICEEADLIFCSVHPLQMCETRTEYLEEIRKFREEMDRREDQASGSSKCSDTSFDTDHLTLFDERASLGGTALGVAARQVRRHQRSHD